MVSRRDAPRDGVRKRRVSAQRAARGARTAVHGLQAVAEPLAALGSLGNLLVGGVLALRLALRLERAMARQAALRRVFGGRRLLRAGA